MNRMLLVLACLACAAATALAAPTPPEIAKQFTANYTIYQAQNNTPNSDGEWYGFLAVDYVNGGMLYTLNGYNLLPIFLSTNFIASPNGEKDATQLYWFYRDICWDTGAVPIEDIHMFPLRIPENATYKGSEVLRGKPCSVWEWDSRREYDANITIWVGQKQSDIVRVSFNNAPEFGVIRWDFLNTVVGPIDPSVYSPPKLPCPGFPYYGVTSPKASRGLMGMISRMMMGFMGMMMR